jgi:hypothetical protein
LFDWAFFQIDGVTKIMQQGGVFIDELKKKLGLPMDSPVDLTRGVVYATAMDLRPVVVGGDDDAMLDLVLRVPLLAKRISTSPEPLREGSLAQQEVAAQPEARMAMGFSRVTSGAYKCSVIHNKKPMRGTPVFCFDAVDYSTAPAPFAP